MGGLGLFGRCVVWYPGGGGRGVGRHKPSGWFGVCWGWLMEEVLAKGKCSLCSGPVAQPRM